MDDTVLEQRNFCGNFKYPRPIWFQSRLVHLRQIVRVQKFAVPPCVPKLLPQNLESPVLPAALPSWPVYTARMVADVEVQVPPRI